MNTATIYPSGSGSRSIEAGAMIGSSTMPGPPPGMPASIDRSQLYYWSSKWQADEAESLAELAQGEGHRFESVREAMAWLLSDDD